VTTSPASRGRDGARSDLVTNDVPTLGRFRSHRLLRSVAAQQNRASSGAMGHHGCLAAPQSTAWVEAGRRRREASTVSSVLITCCATPGHVDPACAIASDLVQRGHRVRILTGPRYRRRLRRAATRG
jgi:hypothetical protein